MKVTPRPAAAPGAETAGKPSPAQRTDKKAGGKADGGGEAKVVDPLQWWGALTQQFQQIAANAMKDVAATTEAAAAQGGKAAPGGAGPAAPNGRARRKAAAPRKRTARQAAG